MKEVGLEEEASGIFQGGEVFRVTYYTIGS